MQHRGADHLVVVMKRSNVRGAKGVGHSHRNRNGPTGNRRSSLVVVEGGSPLMNGTSRVTGDCHARICEGLGVKVPGPTRRGYDRLSPIAL
jgi:hypothetical protein